MPISQHNNSVVVVIIRIVIVIIITFFFLNTGVIVYSILLSQSILCLGTKQCSCKTGISRKVFWVLNISHSTLYLLLDYTLEECLFIFPLCFDVNISCVKGS